MPPRTRAQGVRGRKERRDPAQARSIAALVTRRQKVRQPKDSPDRRLGYNKCRVDTNSAGTPGSLGEEDDFGRHDDG